MITTFFLCITGCIGYKILKKRINARLLNQFCMEEIDFSISSEMRKIVKGSAKRASEASAFSENAWDHDLQYFITNGISYYTLENQLKELGDCVKCYSHSCADMVPIIFYLKDKLKEVNTKRSQLGLPALQDRSPESYASS